ncbi:hypothetical protein AAMO2058_000270800 [Amorphochlora amoebiformis]
MAAKDLRSGALSGNIEAVRKAIKSGARVERTDRFGRTALMHAANRGHMELVRVLVEEFGAKVRAKDNQCRNAVMDAAMEGHADIIRLLAQRFGANVHSSNKYGATALTYGAHEGRLEVVRTLVEDCQASINTRDINGDTPLIVAARWGHPETVQYLLEAKADLRVKGREDKTALEWALAKGREAITKSRNAAERQVSQRYDTTASFLWRKLINPTISALERDTPGLWMLHTELTSAVFGYALDPRISKVGIPKALSDSSSRSCVSASLPLKRQRTE